MNAVACKGPNDRHAMWFHSYLSATALDWVYASPVVLEIDAVDTSPRPMDPVLENDPDGVGRIKGGELQIAP